MESPQRIAVIGAGFGGISVAKVLSHSKNAQVDIIDRRNYHLFQPLLYQVAMAGLNPSDIAIPIRKFFGRTSNTQVYLAEVDQVDIEQMRILFDNKWHYYDYIVLACGSKHFYFGKNEWELVAPGLKNIEQATEIRRRVLTAFELAEKETDREKQEHFLTFVVVGGGPTGVELAGAIAEMAKNTLVNDFKNADLNKTKVYLVEAGPRLLAAFPENLSAKVEEDLSELGIEILKNTRASDLSFHGLQAGERYIPAETIIWAAGVKPASLIEKLEAPKDKQGRLTVLKDLSLPGHPNVFAIGDIASFMTAQGEFLPGLAPVAIQQGNFLGHLIADELKGRARKEFKYLDKGMMATIGRSRAVVSSGRLQLTGFVAWIAWVLIHIMYLMRFKNRVFVFLQWVWAYFRFGQGARLIVHKTWRFYSGEKLKYRDE